LQKFLAAHLAAAGFLALHELALDDHLRRDARVVRAGLPEHVLALHARVTRQNVLQRVVERMAHVQIAGDVRRRNDDGIGGASGPLGPAGAKSARIFPIFSDASLDRGRVEGLFHCAALEASCRRCGLVPPKAGARYWHGFRLKSNKARASPARIAGCVVKSGKGGGRGRRGAWRSGCFEYSPSLWPDCDYPLFCQSCRLSDKNCVFWVTPREYLLRRIANTRETRILRLVPEAARLCCRRGNPKHI